MAMPAVPPDAAVADKRPGNLPAVLAGMEGELVSRTFAIPTQYEDERFVRAAMAAVAEVSAEERLIPSDMEACARHYESECLPVTTWRRNQRTEYFVSLSEYRYLDLDYLREQRRTKAAALRFYVAACAAAAGWIVVLLIVLKHALEAM